MHKKAFFNKRVKYIERNIIYTTYRENSQILHLITCYLPANSLKTGRNLMKKVLGMVKRIRDINP